ncbi:MULTISPECIES: hypothetical protein [Desulfococcus]|jgi:hypothetical protein|uniref:Uncharacterized protein n=1 Tax=Desulfococcus multivorans DSM 2059 TaxID=1121405 RepID=S7VBM6_DESML|nr:hypothetical protein [Desulfococcus multivorans]AOY56853.1 uncharacterized protein Dmul_00770 [Desulfococcus multivorans]AQU99396.1 hypothetical protein B2D07_00390 [Desulfococcus multivorans]EPR41868.1 hypothetical protein dsmv_1867 [Desulfococcus multivorans DSM 2059]MDX9817321.1 hypothetical protein [Desulfococcus multivorans]SJZ93325.1 hypothetical protein SAMN02745446_02145 [Desulfococcus multivorans DSM 2059]
METEFTSNPTQEKEIDVVLHEIRKELENAHKGLLHLQDKLGDSMARAALGEDNHTQIARIKRRIGEIEETIQQAPLVIRGLKRLKTDNRS